MLKLFYMFFYTTKCIIIKGEKCYLMGFLNVCITILNILCKGGLWGKLEQAILFLFRNDNSPGK